MQRACLSPLAALTLRHLLKEFAPCRTCLGQKYALTIGALVIGRILQQYNVTLSGGAERDMFLRCQNLSLEARHGIQLTFQPRQNRE